MSPFVLSAETSFSAAHTLPGVDLCDRFHGHNWRVRLSVSVDDNQLDAGGMGVDFRILEDIARDAVSEFEHRYLNDLPSFQDSPPTAERIAKLVFSRAETELQQRAPTARVSAVDVWETPEYCVTYQRA